MAFNTKIVFKILGIVGSILSLFMVITMVASFYFNENIIAQGFFTSAGITIIISVLFLFLGREYETQVHNRDGFLIVSASWLFTAILGAMPYLFTGVTGNFIDGFFEATSTFTTTNATVLDLDILPKSMILWRGLCNWLGGMGIIILALSILPSLGIGGQNLAKTEIPGASLHNFSSSASNFAKILYVFYIGLTVTMFILLYVGPMSSFEALINTLSGVSTSGLPVTKYGELLQNDFYSQVIISIFSVLASINFIIFFFLIQGNWKAILSNIEFKTFLLLIFLGSMVVSVSLFFSKTYTLIDAFKYGFFQTISIATTAGFWLVECDNWPALTITMLVILMVIGGSSFSTAGSMKVVRFLVMTKLVGRGFSRRLHPRSVVAVKLGDEVISAQRVSYTTVFILVFFITILGGTVLLSLQNLDLLTTLSSAVAMISNTGIGLGSVGSGNFQVYSHPLRIVLAFLMFAGRLELFSVILLFLPSFWNPAKNRRVV